MTLPGIAGIILTIGVAADANVVIFERIKEEVRVGEDRPRGHLVGLLEGLPHDRRRERGHADHGRRALPRRRTGSVKGFAFLLALGVLVSMFSAVASTRAMLGILRHFKWFNNVAFMGASGSKPVRWHIDFVGPQEALVRDLRRRAR